MSQQGSSRYWLTVGLFLSLNACGLVWIRQSWSPQPDATRHVLLDVSPRPQSNQPALEDDADSPSIDPTQIVVTPAPKVIEPARILAWLPVSNTTSALTPENVIPGAEGSGEVRSKPNFDQAERLVAVFDRPIVDERDLNRPLEAAPFHLEPRIGGHWRWTSVDRLAFVLDRPLPAGRKIELTAAVDFTDQTQVDLTSSSKRFQFETRALELQGVVLHTYSRDSVTFELAFNQPVSPSDLSRHLIVSDSAFPASPAFDEPTSADSASRQSPTRGPAFECAVLTKEAGSKLIVRTKRPTAALRIALSPSLAGEGAELPLGSMRQRDLAIPATFAFVRSQIDADSFSEAVAVRLYFSAGLTADQEKPKVKVSPAVEDLHLEFAPGTAGADSYHAGIVLRGKFQCGHRYALTMPPTILANDGQTLGETSPLMIDVPHRPADLRITAGQGILIPDGNLTLDLQCVNIDGVHMSASRLHANNLAAFLQSRNDSATMRSIVHERVRSLDLPKDQSQTIALDLRQLLTSEQGQRREQVAPALRGIYRVTVADANESWNRDMATVAITDLGLTAKRGRDGWLVWVLSLRTAQPQAGVTVVARSFNNQILAQSVTDASGIAALNIPDNHPDGTVWLLTAERDGDLNYLVPDRHTWMIDSVDQSGRPWPQHYEAMLYTERGVYRPGDVVHVTGILRDRTGQRPPSFPLNLKVTRPDGRVVAKLPCQASTDRQGVFQIDYPSSPTGQTGVYRFEVSIPGSNESLGTTQAQIEAFVPIRIAVEAAATQPRFIREVPTIRATGRYLFGQPAAGLDVAAAGTWQRIAFTSKDHPGYSFGDFSGRNQQQLAEVNRKLDDAGECELQMALPKDERPGVWMAAVATTVTETGGRSVSATCRLEADTAGIHIGVKPPEKKIVVVDEVTSVDWVLLNGDGSPAMPQPLDMSLVRVDYDTVVAQVNGRPVWKTMERLIEIEAKRIEGQNLSGSGSLELTCPVAGRYRLRIVEPETKSATQIEFYASTHQSDRVDVPLQQPEELEVVLDQSKYRPGDLAKVLVRAPFPGQLLLTMEGDRVYDRRVITLEANSQMIEVPVPADLRGGAYVTATVIRPIDPQRTDWLPHRAYGLARLTIDPTSRELAVKLETVERTLPGSILKVCAQTAWSAAADQNQSPPVVHLWAVDEGILLTTRYSVPRPLDYFHKPRKLGVSTADVYSSLLPDHLRPANMTRIGADAGDQSDHDVDDARRSPVDTPRTLPAVVWQSVLPVGDDGTLTVDLPLPQLTGTMRLMAVAIHGDRYGSTEQRVTVTSPLLVESTWPRAIAPRDQFRVPVKLFNTTSAPLDAVVRAVVSGPVTVQWVGSALPDGTATVKIQPGQSSLQWINVTGQGLGPATVRIEATAIDADGTSLTALAETGVAVRSATPLDSETTITRHRVGEPVTLDPAPGFLQGSTRTSIAISALPSVELNPALDSLIDYPYGCGEQTSSRLYALLAAQKWLASGTDTNVDESRRKFVSQLIDAGVVRLWSMQNRNGGLGYWIGGPSDPWISAYAAGAVFAAREAGHAVDPALVADLTKYLESVLDGQSGVDVDLNTRAFLCNILASIDRPKQGWMSRLADQIDFLDSEGRAHLAAAWIRVGRKDRAAAALPEGTFRLSAVSSSSGRITSRVRQDAVLLQVLLDLDSQHPAIPVLVERVQSARQKQTWMNTLENATAISALARYRATNPITSDFTGILQKGSIQSPFSHTSPLHNRWENVSEPLTITTQGQGEFYVVRTVEGLREQQQVVSYDRQLKVRRQWLDREDREVDPTKLRVGDLVQVAVQISSPDAREGIPNVAIVDALPGGVEIENPRLATSSTNGDGAQSTADHVEFLDDRAVLFTTVGGSPKVFRYAVRVTTPGRFELPPIQASSMYDPSVASVHGGGKVIVFARDEEIHDVAERPDDNAAHRN